MFLFIISVQSLEQAVVADLPSLAALGAVRQVRHAVEVEAKAEAEADPEVTAYQSARTMSAGARRKAATKAQTNGKAGVNDDGARPEEGTTINENDLGNTTATTSERRQDLTGIIVISEKRYANEVDLLILKAEVDREVGVQ